MHTFATWLRQGVAYDARAAYLEAMQAWLPAFDSLTEHKITVDELVLLGDLFYLPHSFGNAGRAWLAEMREWLPGTPVTSLPGETLRTATRCFPLLFDKLTALRNRDLVHSLYAQLWEIKELSITLQAWIRWREQSPEAGPTFAPPEYQPGVLRGSFAALWERFAPVDDSGRFAPAPELAQPRGFRLRAARAEDEDAAYRVCLLTGDSGLDGTALYRDDPKALGEIYVGPYLYHEPDLAFLLEDDEGVCGYVLAALDSVVFDRFYREQWLPPLQRKYPRPAGDPSHWTPTQRLYAELHAPDSRAPEALRAFPSHAHIDLLPRAQGKGQGKRMMRHILAALAARGSTGVHLGVSVSNPRALAFYAKLGFVEIQRVPAGQPEVVHLARPLP